MTERMTLEQRINSYIRDFKENCIEYDDNFVREQVTAQYPWKSMKPNKWKWQVSYHIIYPKKDAIDNKK